MEQRLLREKAPPAKYVPTGGQGEGKAVSHAVTAGEEVGK